MNLGELIARLRKCPPTAIVEFDFCQCVPTQVGSWRGIYADLALGWCERWGDGGVKEMTVSAMLENLEAAVGATFEGWKGGDYRMGAHTDVWVDNHGECTHTAITGLVEIGDYAVVIETRRKL